MKKRKCRVLMPGNFWVVRMKKGKKLSKDIFLTFREEEMEAKIYLNLSFLYEKFLLGKGEKRKKLSPEQELKLLQQTCPNTICFRKQGWEFVLCEELTNAWFSSI